MDGIGIEDEGAHFMIRFIWVYRGDDPYRSSPRRPLADQVLPLISQRTFPALVFDDLPETLYRDLIGFRLAKRQRRNPIQAIRTIFRIFPYLPAKTSGMNQLSPFHLAIPVRNLSKARQFYGEVMGCEEGRSDTQWVDFNFYGHQLVIHEKPSPEETQEDLHHNPVDGHDVPIPHFGVVLDWDVWHELADRLKAQKISFVIEPYIRFQGQVGEQATMFFLDPSGNALEFKAFKDISQLFAK